MPKGVRTICTGLPDLVQETHVLLEWSLEAEQDALWHLK